MCLGSLSCIKRCPDGYVDLINVIRNLSSIQLCIHYSFKNAYFSCPFPTDSSPHMHFTGMLRARFVAWPLPLFLQLNRRCETPAELWFHHSISRFRNTLPSSLGPTPTVSRGFLRGLVDSMPYREKSTLTTAFLCVPSLRKHLLPPRVVRTTLAPAQLSRYCIRFSILCNIRGVSLVGLPEGSIFRGPRCVCEAATVFGDRA